MNSKKIAIEFGKNLRQLRTEQQLSQQELADSTGLSRVYIGEIERGAKNITLEKVYLFARVLNCNLDKLLPKQPK